MRVTHKGEIHVRVTPAMRAALDAEARVSGASLSVATRTALSLGLRALRASSDYEPPRPSGPAASMAAAA
ncbi:hypothetical protein GU700_07255 [Methylobacterium sp. NI91]|nr:MULTISPECIES: hypothetical protein [unclassified Methylobacterium]QIJ74393.1 hypothetical protein CLZ_07255 [Methylobacterium sp. CLZ]QIJ79299.1 hypothetical protein GU700_07255 [Methylobacterium sp. NI91]